MTEEQKQDLNPLTIKIRCASCLPTQPVSIHDLEVRLNPCLFPLRAPPYHTRLVTVCHLLFQVLTVRNITHNFPFWIL